MKLSEQPKIIFFDIDETLYIKAKERIPVSISEQVIPRLRAKGIIPAIATGRCFGVFPEALKPLLGERGFELLVTINGQHNSYKGELISQYPLAVERIEQAVSCLNRLSVPYGLVSEEEICVSENTSDVQEALFQISAQYTVEPDLYCRKPIFQLLAFFPASKQVEIEKSGLLGDDLKIVRWHNKAVDILSKHNSKAKGIRDVLDHFGFSMSQAMAFGDGLNDLEMLSMVGTGVAMGNGEQELKALADFVTNPIEQNGVLFALEQLGVI